MLRNEIAKVVVKYSEIKQTGCTRHFHMPVVIWFPGVRDKRGRRKREAFHVWKVRGNTKVT